MRRTATEQSAAAHIPKRAGRRGALLFGGAAVVVIVLLIGVLGACGGDRDDSRPAVGPGTAGEVRGATATDAATTSEELGEEVAQHYFDALDRLATLLDRGLPADSLRVEVRSLKDEYIETFVSYGYKREAMTGADRETFDAKVRQAVALSTPSALDTMNAAQAGLIEDGEYDFADEISSFNIITQYAFFDLLKEQEPEEAQRLGIP